MKNPFLFYILACMTSIFLFFSCEQSELQTKVKADDTIPLTNRSGLEDCEDCPIDDCCCVVEILSGSSVDILFCDVYSGKSGSTCGTFTPAAPCGTISGISTTISLDMNLAPRSLFCVPPGGSFRMLKTMPAGNVLVRITCQYNQVNPDWENVPLSTNPVYFYVDGECTLLGC